MLRQNQNTEYNQQYSVLMSVYEKEQPEYLQQSIQSMLVQTVPTDDFIIVCDGPLTPELDHVLHSFSQIYPDTIHIIRREQNEGLGVALNIGLSYCKNDLVARMDSDDVSEPDRCEKQLKLFEETPNLKIASCMVKEFSESVDCTTGMRNVPVDHEEICRFSRKRNPFNHPAVMFYKQAVQQAGGYLNTYPLFEDYYLWIRMLQIGCLGKNLPEPLLNMRAPQNMYSRRGGLNYTKNMLCFHRWMVQSGWSTFIDFCTGAVPHAVVCVLPNGMRKMIYHILH